MNSDQPNIHSDSLSDSGEDRLYARLVFLENGEESAQKDILRHCTLIGAARGCNIQLISSTVSEAHCAITLESDRLELRDLRSKTGTLLNGSRIDCATLADGDMVTIGRFQCRVETNLPRFFFNQVSENKNLLHAKKVEQAISGKVESDFYARLIFEDSQENRLEKDIFRHSTLIGSLEGSNIQLIARDVSPAHCLIVMSHGLLYLHDLRSKAGTQVNGISIHVALLTDGDIITLGRKEFRVETNLIPSSTELINREESTRGLPDELAEKELSLHQKEIDLQTHLMELEEKEARIEAEFQDLNELQNEFLKTRTEWEEIREAQSSQLEQQKNEHDSVRQEELAKQELREQEKKKFEEELSQFKKEQFEFNRHLADHERKIEEFEAGKKAFEEKKEKITRELIEHRDQHEQEQKELKESLELLSQKQDDLLDKIETRASVEAKLERQTQEIQQKQEELNQQEEEFRQKYEQILKDEEQLLHQKKTEEEKESHLLARDDELTRREQKLKQREKELGEVQEELERNREEYQQFLNEKELLEEQKTLLEQKEKELDDLNREIAELRSATHNQGARLHSEQEGLENKQTRFEEELVEQEKQLREYQEQIELQNRELEKQKQELIREKLDLEDEKSRLHSKAERLTHHAELYEHRQSVQEGMAQQLENQRKKLQSDLNRIREEIRNSQNQLKQDQTDIEKERQKLVWERRTFEQEKRVFQQQKADLYRQQKKAGEGAGPTEKEISLMKRLCNRGFMTQFQADWFLEGSFKNYLIEGRYELISLLDTGGMGWLYCALDKQTGKKVVLKILQEPNLSDPGLLTRFRQEAKATLELNHPNVIRSFYYGEAEDFHYLVMEYLQGINMIELVRLHGPIPYQMACSIIIQAARGLKHIHEHNMVHRDIKPSNFLIDQKGQVKILDFGLVLIDGNQNEDEFTLAMLFGHDCLGTADYIAPEQSLDSFQVDFRADLYSLGCAFYYALTGTVPFPEKSNIEKIEAHRSRSPQPVNKIIPDVPVPIARIVKKLIAKHPDQRYQHIDGLIRDLKPFAQTLPIVFDHTIILRLREERAKARLYRMAEMIQTAKSDTADDTRAGDVSNAKTFTDLRMSDPNR